MRPKKENIICFENYRHQLQNKDKTEHYDCFVTEDRLAGFCELLICEKGRQSGQWFYLKFPRLNLPVFFLSLYPLLPEM